MFFKFHLTFFFSLSLQLQSGHEKVAEQISRDLSQLCTRLASLWAQFVEAAVPNPHVRSHLAQEHHKLRVGEPATISVQSKPANLSM